MRWCDTLLLDGADPVLTGPGGARVVGMLAAVGEGIAGPAEGAGEELGLRWACSALDGPGWLLLALGDSPAAVSALLDQAVPHWSEFGSALSSTWSVSGTTLPLSDVKARLSELGRRVSEQHERIIVTRNGEA